MTKEDLSEEIFVAVSDVIVALFVKRLLKNGYAPMDADAMAEQIFGAFEDRGCVSAFCDDVVDAYMEWQTEEMDG